jgi:hypothetical protein
MSFPYIWLSREIPPHSLMRKQPFFHPAFLAVHSLLHDVEYVSLGVAVDAIASLLSLSA